MSTNAIAWGCSLLLVGLLAFGLRPWGARGARRGPSGLLLLAEVAAAASLLANATALGRGMVAGSALVVLATVAVVVAKVRRRRRGDVVMLHAANDEGASIRLRVLSHVLEPSDTRLLRFR